MSRFRVGVQFHPQHTSVADLRAAWRRADAIGVDSLWVWDHFFPLYPKGGPYLWPPAGDLKHKTHRMDCGWSNRGFRRGAGRLTAPPHGITLIAGSEPRTGAPGRPSR